MKGEMQVQRAVEAFSAFISPLEVEDGLVSLASGRKVQKDISYDQVSVGTAGKALFDSFVKNRLKQKTVNVPSHSKRPLQRPKHLHH